jgi:hypothetical protein
MYSMNTRVDLDLVCPNGHNVAVDFTQEEFEAALKSDTLEFHCNTCDTDWTPTPQEMAKFRKLFPEPAH